MVDVNGVAQSPSFVYRILEIENNKINQDKSLNAYYILSTGMCYSEKMKSILLGVVKGHPQLSRLEPCGGCQRSVGDQVMDWQKRWYMPISFFDNNFEGHVNHL